MKLFTKDIDDKLFEQYSKGADLENQVAVAKIFNPYGRGTWYLLNSDPNDPDYLWAIVDLYEVESGSASRSELESIKVPPFNQHLERDLGFKPVNALELFNNLRENKQRNRMMAKGGNIKQIPVGEEYRYKGSSSIEKEIMEKINPQLKGLRFAGNFYIKDWKEDGYLYFLDDYDRKFVSDVNLKQNERIYRYFTRVTALGGMIPLVKINLENGLAYFNEKGHEGEIEFSSKGMKTDYLNLVKVEEEDYYAEGGGVYRLKDFDFNEEGNLQAIINDKKYEIIYRDDVSQMYDLFENGKVIKSSMNINELTKFAEGGKVYSHDIDIISKSSNDPYFMFPKPTTGKSMGVELKDGGNIDFNIQVGDSVWVDNPYWKASTRNEKPVRRTVKMILGDSVFFSDGSNSSIQYLKKYKTEKTMAEGGGVGDDLELLKNKIRSISKKMEYDGESGYGGYVVYLNEDKIKISNYTDLSPYSAQATDGNEVKVSFKAPNRTMITFSTSVTKPFEDRKSFEKYGGIIYIYEPLTQKIASQIINKIENLKVLSNDAKNGKKYETGGGVGLKANDIALGTWLQHKTTKTKAKVWNVEPITNRMQLQDVYGNKDTKWRYASEWKITTKPKEDKYETGGNIKLSPDEKKMIRNSYWANNDVDVAMKYVSEKIPPSKYQPAREYMQTLYKTGGNISERVVAPKGYVFAKIGSHRTREKVKRAGAKYVSVWTFGGGQGTAGSSTIFLSESDYNKIKDITGVSKSTNSLRANSNHWFAREENEDLRKIFNSIEQKHAKGGVTEHGLKRGGIMGDVFSLANKNQFEQIITIYNDLTNLGVGTHDLFIDHKDNTVVFFVDSKISDLGKDKVKGYIESLKNRGFDIIDYNKTLSNYESNWVSQKSSMAFKVYLKENIKYANGGKVTPAKQKKVAKVMKEWKKGELHIGKSDKIVKDQKQAVAIALSEAGLSKPTRGWKHKRKK